MKKHVFTILRNREIRIFQLVSILFLYSLCAFSQLKSGNKTETFQKFKDGFVRLCLRNKVYCSAYKCIVNP